LSILTTVTLDAQLLQHRQKGGHAIEAGAIPDAGWYCDDGNRNQAADNARKRAFHAGDHNEHPAAADVPAGQQTVQPETPTSYNESTVLPITLRVTTASSATGISDVPAETTITVPLP
jgi:hypothetical protein